MRSLDHTRRYEELCDVQITKSNKCREFNFSIKEPDCFFSVKSGHIIKITDFNLSTDCIFGRSFKEQSDMYKIEESMFFIFFLSQKFFHHMN